ncbi:hypothetical protein J6590_051640 [Homalodisca vitripennis]|nr:hypothetical protein J6590_051640 [Homalodisca vitripennis]
MALVRDIHLTAQFPGNDTLTTPIPIGLSTGWSMSSLLALIRATCDCDGTLALITALTPSLRSLNHNVILAEPFHFSITTCSSSSQKYESQRRRTLVMPKRRSFNPGNDHLNTPLPSDLLGSLRRCVDHKAYLHALFLDGS